MKDTERVTAYSYENGSVMNSSFTLLQVTTIFSHPDIKEYNVDDIILNATLISEYLKLMLGPQRLKMTTLLPLTVVYALILVIGLVGNLCTCYVIVRSPQMQTATNFYLFSLSVADIVSLILGLPNDLTVYWRQYPYMFGPIFCSLRALVSEMTNNASVLTIVAFTVERWLAICHPLRKQKMSSLSRVVKIIAVLWAVAFSSAIPFAVFTRIRYIDFPQGSGNNIDESAFCAMTSENNHHNMPLLLFSSFVFFVIPLLFIAFLYCLIGMQLRKARMSRLTSESYQGNKNNRQHSKKVLKILVSVVVAFFVCWAPFHAQRLMFVYLDEEDWEDERLRDANEKLYYVAGCFYYFNCIINPILYNLISDKYRRAFHDTLCCCCYSKPRRLKQRIPVQPYPNHSSQAFAMSHFTPVSLKDISAPLRTDKKQNNTHVVRHPPHQQQQSKDS